jgi:hypothetical protein
MLRFAAFAAFLLAAPPAPLAAQSRAEQAAIDVALARGRILFAVDRAAWVATDDLRAKLPNFENVGLRGYVVERDGNDALQVIFYGGPAGAPIAFYRARIERNRLASSEVYPAAARPALTPFQRRLVAARDAAGASTRRRPCAGTTFNTAVIPPPTAEAPIFVYLLTPQTRSGEYPFGGHYRLTVAADGRVSDERAFTNSCLTMDPRRGVPAGGAPTAMVVTHLLDPVPTEIHVFNAISAGMPVIVGIARPERIYEVTGERMRLIQQGAPAPRRRK